jgi:hypothetical protein
MIITFFCFENDKLDIFIIYKIIRHEQKKDGQQAAPLNLCIAKLNL